MGLKPTGSHHEQGTTVTCRCGAAGVFVAPFTWGAERYLQWRCDTCGRGWATPERRVIERRTGASNSDRHLAHDRRARPRRVTERSSPR